MKHILFAALLVFASPLVGDFSPGGPGAAASFPNGASIDSLTLSGTSTSLTHYESGTLDVPCSSSRCVKASYTFYYVRMGDVVCVEFPKEDVVLTGTSFPIFEPFPVQLRPSTFKTVIFPLVTNGTGKIAYGGFYSNGRVDVYEDFLTNDIVFPSGATLKWSHTTGETTQVCYNKN